jgi:hypothetical protein
MVWNGRYRKKIQAPYRVVGGKIPLVITMLVAIFIVVQGIFWRA